MKYSDTVADVKSKIKILEGIAIDQQELSTHDGQELDDGKPLSDYFVGNDLQFDLRLKGKTLFNAFEIRVYQHEWFRAAP